MLKLSDIIGKFEKEFTYKNHFGEIVFLKEGSPKEIKAFLTSKITQLMGELPAETRKETKSDQYDDVSWGWYCGEQNKCEELQAHIKEVLDLK